MKRRSLGRCTLFPQQLRDLDRAVVLLPTGRLEKSEVAVAAEGSEAAAEKTAAAAGTSVAAETLQAPAASPFERDAIHAMQTIRYRDPIDRVFAAIP